LKLKIKDYDLIEKMSLKYAQNINIKEKNISNKDIARLGFYYLGLELVIGFQDINEISDKIIDSSFQAKVNGINNKDYGIDAVHINRDEKIVSLFSFKYRNNLKNGSTKPPAELTNTSGFLSLLKRKEYIEESDSDEITVKIVQEIKDWQKNDPDIKFELYMISNDNADFDQEDAQVQAFQSNYSWLDIKNLNLSDIVDRVSLKPEKNYAEIILSTKELLQHNMDYTTANSYVAKVKLTDLIKITSQDENLRTQNKINDEETLENQKIDLNVLFDNVRGYLGETQHNEKIITTLKQEPEKFFLFNNGLTITAEDIDVKSINMEDEYKICLKNYQIVNGGQTLRSVYAFKENNKNLIKNLVKGFILIRFFETKTEENLVNKVAEYTNSQNAISGRDLKSVDKLQLDIEKRFKVEGINYIRKLNKVDSFDNDSNYNISMEKLGQLLLSSKGHPEKSSNSKKRIFEDYYSHLFNDDDNFMNLSINLVKEYYCIVNEYKKNTSLYDFYEQKIFYIIYLNKNIEDNSTLKNMTIIEKLISNYRAEEDIPPARKLIQKKFKEKVDKEIQNITGRKPPIINLSNKK
jgi:hypothetical protein